MLLECGEWLACGQTDKLARSSLLLLLLLLHSWAVRHCCHQPLRV